jgi:hypothetical protein
VCFYIIYLERAARAHKQAGLSVPMKYSCG